MRIVELNHVAIHVQDVEKSCAFYSQALRLERISRPPFDFPGAWFRLGDNQELHLIGGRAAEVASNNRGNHFALRVEKLAPWEDHFKALGLKIQGPIRRPDGAIQIFIRDVDGHVVELFMSSPSA